MVLASLVASILTRDVDWFARSGSIWCIAGAFLAVWPLVRLGPERSALRARTIDGGVFVQSEEEKKKALEAESKKPAVVEE